MAESKRYSRKDFMRGLLVFETKAEITADLEAGVIPNTLKAGLVSSAPVSINALLSTVRTNNKYEIANGAKKLIVHKDKEFHSPPTFRVYREDFTLETDLIPGTEIVGTCFYRESPLGETDDPYKAIFPALMTGVVFKRCNLDNIYVPPGNTIMDADGCPSSHRRIRVQYDMQDWIVDSAGKPVEPLSLSTHAELGLSPDPKDIPSSPVGVSP